MKFENEKLIRNLEDIKTEQSALNLGFIFLILFCAVRPILLLNLNIGIAGFNLLELFAISISYLLLLAIAANIKTWKLDFVSIIIIFFCFYCVFSIFWGSKLKPVSQIILPFVIFFSIRLFIKDQNQISFLLLIIIIAYLIPLFGSFFQILQGTSSLVHVESITGIERYSGLYAGIRPMANAMFFFSVFFYLKYILFRPEGRYIRYVLIIMLLISFYCVFKTYSRSIFLGLFIFWAIVLLGFDKKKYFLIFIILVLSVGLLYQAEIRQIYFKTQEFDVKTASSGRSFVWEHNIKLFINAYSFDEKFLGRGLGVVTDGVIGKEWEVWSSHNDYLHLLMQLGGIGLFLYLLIHLAILKEVLYGNIEKKIKYFYIGLISSIIFMNFASGIITFNLPTAQLFWMIMGFYYTFTIYSETSMDFNKSKLQCSPK